MDFKKIKVRMSQKSISDVKKSFFETSMRLVFWPIEFFNPFSEPVMYTKNNA